MAATRVRRDPASAPDSYPGGRGRPSRRGGHDPSHERAALGGPDLRRGRRGPDLRAHPGQPRSVSAKDASRRIARAAGVPVAWLQGAGRTRRRARGRRGAQLPIGARCDRRRSPDCALQQRGQNVLVESPAPGPFRDPRRESEATGPAPSVEPPGDAVLLAAPCTVSVWRVDRGPGAPVTARDRRLELDAVKMETGLAGSRDLLQALVGLGGEVQAGAPLIVLALRAPS